MATNFMPEPDELEELILDTVRKTAISGKIQVTLMLAAGKLRDVPWMGKKSLKVVESMPGSKVDSVSDKDKPRKLSNNEGRLRACSCSMSPKLMIRN